MTIKQQNFGTYEGQEITLFTLENANGMSVKIMNYGATITQVTIPGENTSPVSLVCGFDQFEEYFSEEYKANAPYFGCTVGRYCSQIKNSKFTLNNTEYKLANNCGDNNLHGGTIGFDKKVWIAKPLDAANAILFSLQSKDMEEGFPGNVEAHVRMKLSDDNQIVIDYEASTDKATPFSMTNHSYWNLSGFKQTVEGFEVEVATNKLQEMDDTGAGTGKILDVSGTTEDLQQGKKISDVHAALGGGFEHFYVFDNEQENLNRIAAISDEASGRKLEVYSTEPCMLFYTAKYMSDNLQRNEKEKYGKYRAFACETHRWQNGPNIPESPKTFLNAGDKFKSTTIFKLNW